MRDFAEFDVVVIRKPPPDRPPAFRCVVCDRIRQGDPWKPDGWGKPPVCTSCVRHWSAFTRLPLRFVSRSDHLSLSRLSAVLKRLEWEVINGRRRWA